MFLTDFDNGIAFIEPKKALPKIEGMPKVCIGVFSDAVVTQWVKENNAEIIYSLNSVCGDRPLYKIKHNGNEFALFLAPLGAPAAAGYMEELIARGVQSFVFCGCCGVLRHDIADGHLIVPNAAIRDEGLSFHYLEASDEIELDPVMVKTAVQVFEELGLPYVSGKTWTTDAFYRETHKKIEQAKAMGAICVEMECAAMAAVGKFRNIPFIQFFWAADNLDTAEWDSRSLNTKGLSFSEKCFAACTGIATKLNKMPSVD